MGNYLQLIIIIIKVFAILLFPQETHLQSWILQLFPILLILTWLELGKKLLTSHKLSLLSTLSKPSHFQQWTIYFLCLSILSPTLSFSCLSLSLNFSAPCCPLLFSRGVFSDSSTENPWSSSISWAPNRLPSATSREVRTLCRRARAFLICTIKRRRAVKGPEVFRLQERQWLATSSPSRLIRTRRKSAALIKKLFRPNLKRKSMASLTNAEFLIAENKAKYNRAQKGKKQASGCDAEEVSTEKFSQSTCQLHPKQRCGHKTLINK